MPRQLRTSGYATDRGCRLHDLLEVLRFFPLVVEVESRRLLNLGKFRLRGLFGIPVMSRNMLLYHDGNLQ